MGNLFGLKVKFKGNSLQEFSRYYATDISPTGIFVRTRTPFAIGTRIRFDFRLENGEPLLNGEGIVLWVAEDNPDLKLPSGMELRFESLSPESETRFQWLQLSKRGVTVGRELPLSISTSTQPETKGENTHQKSARWLEADQLATVISKQQEPPVDGLDAVTEISTTNRLHADPNSPARNTQPRWKKTPTPSSSKDPHQPPALPGDSDPGQLFYQVASSTMDKLDDALTENTVIPKSTIGHFNFLKLTNFNKPWVLVVICLIAFGSLIAGMVFWKSTNQIDATTPDANAEEVSTSPKGIRRVIRLTTIPGHTNISLDGQDIGTAPLEIEVRGRVNLKIQYPGFISKVVQIDESDPRWNQHGTTWVMDLRQDLQPNTEPAKMLNALPPSARPDPGLEPTVNGHKLNKGPIVTPLTAQPPTSPKIPLASPMGAKVPNTISHSKNDASSQKLKLPSWADKDE